MRGTTASENVSVGSRGDGNSRLYALYAKVAAEVEASLAAGHRPDIEDYVGRYPEFAQQIRELLPAIVAMAELAVESKLPRQSDRGVEAGSPGLIGEFRIIREVGRGGMGIVYEAEQMSLGRRVALKALPAAVLLDATHLQRFKNEAHAAAQLHHQNIVPVYSVGCDRGVHYYAMQFIDGPTLARIIHELRILNGLQGGGDGVSAVAGSMAAALFSGGARPAEPGGPGESGTQPFTGAAVAPAPPGSSTPLEAITAPGCFKTDRYFRTVAQLGLQAAEGLEHAHQMGVIHRDIKPANLLVDERGNLWITDFGLAHIETTHQSLTQSGRLVGTTRYMSPEQAMAGRVPIGHHTDIYSLGATLYELLALEPAIKGDAREELLRQITLEEPSSVRSDNPAVPVELETIVLKAMSKSPGERYGSARELADDLRRFLEDKPILARRPTVWQRIQKGVRRHRTAVIAAGVVAFLGTGIVAVVSTIGYRSTTSALRRETVALAQAKQDRDRMQQERDRAEENLVLARRAATHLAGLHSTPFRAPETIRALKAAEFVFESLVRSDPGDKQARLGLAKILHNRGIVHTEAGPADEAEAVLTRAERILGELLADHPGDPEILNEMAKTHNSMGNLQNQIGASSLSLVFHQRALDMQQLLVAADPEHKELRSELATMYHNISNRLRQAGRLDEAFECGVRACELYGALRDTHPGDKRIRHGLAKAQNGVGVTLEKSGKVDESFEYYRRAIEIWRALAQENPAIAEFRQHVGTTTFNIGNVHLAAARSDEAFAAYLEARDILEVVVTENPDNLTYRNQYCILLNDLGLAFGRIGRHEDAREVFERAVELQRAALQRNPTSAEHRWLLSHHYYNLASTLRSLKRPGDTVAIVLERKKLWGSNPALLYDMACELALCVPQVAGDDPQQLTDEQRSLRRQCIDLALKTLQESVAAGFRDLQRMRADPDLAALRDEAMFQEMVAGK